MADQVRVVEVGVHADVTGQDDLQRFVSIVRQLMQVNPGALSGLETRTRTITRTAKDGAVSITQYQKAIDLTAASLKRQTAEERAAEAAILRAETAYKRASLAADSFAASQNKISSKGVIAFLSSPQIREAGESIQQAGSALTQFITVPLIGLGRISAQNAIAIDSQVNSLKALTGSAQAAEVRFAQLFNLAQKTPGLTSSVAVALDTQLKLIKVSTPVIDRFLVTVGKLNAVQPVGDAGEFASNLRQIFQNFDKADLKQLAERSPIGADLIKQVFNVDSATNSEAIKKSADALGIKTAEQFFTAFSKAGENSPLLAKAQESLASKIEKSSDRLRVALRPLGLSILDALIPAVQAAVPIIEKLSSAFASAPDSVKVLILAIAGLAAGLPIALTALGSLVQLFQVFQLAKLLQVGAALTTTGEAAAAGAVGVTAATGAMTGLRAALAATSTFLLTTPAGWAVLATSVALATAAYLAFNNSQGQVIERADNLNLEGIQKQFDQVGALRDQITSAEGLTGATANLNAEQAKYSQLLQQLPAQQQRIIESLDTYTEKVNQLRLAQRQALNDRTSQATTEKRILLDGVAARQEEIEASTRQIAALKEEQKARQALLTAGTRQITEFVNTGAETIAVTRNIAEEEQNLDSKRIAAEENLKKLNDAQSTNIQKLRLLLSALQQSEDALLKEAQAGRLSTDQFNLLKKALDDARSRAANLASGSGQLETSLSRLEIQARAAQGALDTLFKGNPSENKRLIDDRINALAGAAVESGKTLKGALKEFDTSIKDATDPLGKQIEAQKKFNDIQKALQERINPPKAPSGGRISRVDRESARQQLSDFRETFAIAEATAEANASKERALLDSSLQENQQHFQARGTYLRAYLLTRQEVQAKLLQIDVQEAQARKTQAQAAIDEIARLRTTTKGKSGELDSEDRRAQTDLIKADADLANARARAATFTKQAGIDAEQALESERRAIQDISAAYFDLNQEITRSGKIRIDEEFKRQIEILESRVEENKALSAKATGDTKTQLDAETRLLQTALERLEFNKQQAILTTQFAALQTELSEIERLRGLNLDSINRKLAETGADEIASANVRRQIMQSYKASIDDVITRLEKLKSAGAVNPEIQRTIDELRNAGAEIGTQSLEELIAPFRLEIEKLKLDRDLELEAIERSKANDLTKEVEKIGAIARFNEKLREQLELWRAIEQRRAGGIGQEFKQAERDINAATVATIDFSQQLQNSALRAGIRGLTDFFTDVATGAKSFKDAALDALGAFLRTITTVIIQILVLKAIEAITGIPVGALLKISAGGFAQGGSIGNDIPGLADGGNVQYNPLGLVKGNGTPRSDSITAYFPVAGKPARISQSEYVLDAETAGFLGEPFLDKLRASKGRMLALADGGAAIGAAAGGSGNGLGGLNVGVQAGDTNIAFNPTFMLDPAEMTMRGLKDKKTVTMILDIVSDNKTRVNSRLAD